MAPKLKLIFAMSRRSAAPRRGVVFPSRAGASGSHHLPWALTRMLPTQAGKREVRRRKDATPAENAALSAERMRAAVSSAAGATTLLQQPVPASGAEVVTVEGPAELSGDLGGQRQTQRAKPALSRARQKPEATSAE